MIIVIIAFILFFLVFVVNAKIKKNLFCASSWLLFIYLFSFFNSIFCILYGGIGITEFQFIDENPVHYMLPATYLFILLLAFLIPFISFNEEKTQKLVLPDERILGIFSSFIIAMSFFAMAFYLPTVKDVFSVGDIAMARDDRYKFHMEYVEGGIINTICSVACSFYEICIMLFFIYLSKGGHKIRSLLLFFASFSNIVHVLTFVGRDGIVFWLFSFVFQFMIFKKFLKPIHRNIITISFGTFGLIIMIPFIMITSGRFGDTILLAVNDYLGQSFPNGVLYFGIEDRPHNYGNSFPLFWEILGKDQPVAKMWSEGGTHSWVFGTFVTTLESDLGTIGSIIACILLGIIFRMVFYTNAIKKQFVFYSMFIYILYFQIFSQGIFYFRQYTRGGNLYFVTSALFYIVFLIIQKIMTCQEIYVRNPEVNGKQ